MCTPEPEAVQDGICYLKVIIDCYHCNARPATAKVKKKLSRLHMYMREAARGDVSKLCQHTRELLNKLYAARETTTVLLPNLLGALALAPNEEFHLWLQRPMIIKATNDSESYTLTL
jgi:sarcosine oxidase delta subunit